MPNTIVFYDIPSTNPEIAWSPNTWNARFTLNIKGLTYKTEWVEYPDIEPLCLKIGAKPTSTKADGRPLYTLPTIYDPSTKSIVSDSAEIVRYLEKQYPDTPKLLPPGTSGFIAAFQAAMASTFSPKLFRAVVFHVWKGLNPESQPYFRVQKEQIFGERLEDLVPEGPAGEAVWKSVTDSLVIVASWYDANAKGSLFISGDSITYADVLLAGRLIWARVALGKDSVEWGKIKEFDGGRWDKFLKNFEKYETVV